MNNPFLLSNPIYTLTGSYHVATLSVDYGKGDTILRLGQSAYTKVDVEPHFGISLAAKYWETDEVFRNNCDDSASVIILRRHLDNGRRDDHTYARAIVYSFANKVTVQ